MKLQNVQIISQLLQYNTRTPSNKQMEKQLKNIFQKLSLLSEKEQTMDKFCQLLEQQSTQYLNLVEETQKNGDSKLKTNLRTNAEILAHFKESLESIQENKRKAMQMKLDFNLDVDLKININPSLSELQAEILSILKSDKGALKTFSDDGLLFVEKLEKSGSPLDYYKTGSRVFECGKFKLEIHYQYLNKEDDPFKNIVAPAYMKPNFPPFVQHPNGGFYVLMPNCQVNYSLILENSDSKTCEVTIKLNNNNTLKNRFQLKGFERWEIERFSQTDLKFLWTPKDSIHDESPYTIPTGYEAGSEDNGLLQIDVNWELLSDEDQDNIAVHPLRLRLQSGAAESSEGYISFRNKSSQTFGTAKSITPNRNRKMSFLFRLVPWCALVQQIDFQSLFTVPLYPPHL